MADAPTPAASGAPEIRDPQSAIADSRSPWRLLGVAAGAGFAAEALVHGRPAGLGAALAGAGLAALWAAGGRLWGTPPSRDAAWLAAALAFFSAMLAVRAGAVLTLFNLLACGGLLLLLAAVHHAGGVGRLSLVGAAAGVGLSAAAAVLQPVVHALDTVRRPPSFGTVRRGGGLLLGVVLALPLLAVFTALFAHADPVFADLLDRIIDAIDAGQIVTRLAASLALTWLVLGLLRRSRRPAGDAGALLDAARPGFIRLGATPAATALALLNVLFATFLAVQAATLFGGADTLARAGVTYSQYARGGFFQLVTVAAFVTALVLVLDAAVHPKDAPRVRAVDGLHVALVVQTLAVLASAVQRMRLYQEAYGLTELRFYTTVFMAWLAVLLPWLALTSLRGRPERFFAGALVSGAGLMAAVNLLNPDAVIARVNLGRPTAVASVPGRAERGLDVEYVGLALSADAVPALVEGLPSVPDPATRAALARALLRKQASLEAQAAGSDWRGWNRGRARALARLREARSEMEKAAGER